MNELFLSRRFRFVRPAISMESTSISNIYLYQPVIVATGFFYLISYYIIDYVLSQYLNIIYQKECVFRQCSNKAECLKNLIRLYLLL